MMNVKRAVVREELEQIAADNDGILRPQDVVEFARNEDTALHGLFEWDDEKAGEAYRLSQARQIIRVSVTILKAEEAEYTVRAFVSLSPDRHSGGGYRVIADVLSEDDQRAQLLQDARKDMEIFQRKYRNLAELSPLFEKIDEILDGIFVEEVAPAD